MFRFEHPEYFIAFAIIPLLVLVWLAGAWLLRRDRSRLADERAYEKLTAGWSGAKITWRNILFILAIAFTCLALTNPQWGMRRESVQAESADIYIALDISTSMLAEDIAPSRLERAKRFGQNLIRRFRGDRIGLILFAGNAYLQMPLTNDYASAELFLRSAHPGLASTQGTSIGEAVDLAMRAYEEDVPHQKALVIITDGENHEDGAIEAMQRGREAGLVPFVVSVGTEEGAFIPIQVGGRQDFKRDEGGTPVKTSVNRDFLTELARTGDGVLYDVLGGDDVLDDMEGRIEELATREMEQRAFTDYRSYFQHFLLLGMACFGIALVMSNRKFGAQPGV